MNAQTGIPGLDDVLNGGLIPNRTYLIEGSPGSGKTTLATQFLLEGARRGQKGLYITLSETREELEAAAASHGWTFDSVQIREYIITDASVERDREVTMFHSSDVELGDTMTRMLQDIGQLRPERVVIDALSELRLLSDSVLRYRRQLLALKKFFSECKCTVLVLDDRSSRERDTHVESIVHGVITLDLDLTTYGTDRRRLRVRKLRAKSFMTGLHDYVIRTGGLWIFPRLVAATHRTAFARESLPSGVAGLDQLLGGGPQRGTSTLLIGPAGCGKTTIGALYAHGSARRGEKAAIYMFDELRELFLARLKAVQLDLEQLIDQGQLLARQIDPTQMSPGEFAALVREDVETFGASVVVIDSLNGYLNAMPHEEFLAAQLHELLAYLGHRGIATFIVVAQQGIVGSQMSSPIDASYLADSIVLFRYFEAQGSVRKAISVAKKRGGSHENTIRELTIDAKGVHVHDALTEFQGVLTGVPVFLRGGS
jgi:circadian clock protein KaiC